MLHKSFSRSAIRQAMLLCFGCIFVSTAPATPLYYGTTTLAFDPTAFTVFTLAGANPSAVAPATYDSSTKTATFPISDIYSALVYHAGALTFTKAGIPSATTETLQSLVFDPITNIISGTEVDRGTAKPNTKFFDLTPQTNGSGYTFDVDPQLAAILSTAFSITANLVGIPFGTAAETITPEPASLALLGSGLILAAALSRRLRRRS